MLSSFAITGQKTIRGCRHDSKSKSLFERSSSVYWI